MSSPSSDRGHGPASAQGLEATSVAFDYASHVADPVRDDLVEAHRSAWRRLARAGTWWTGAERVAIAAESRAAAYCQLCRERRSALSPSAVDGEHDRVAGDLLPAAAVDAVHRIVTDASRLTKSFVQGLATQGVPDAHYVELLSVVVSVRSIDAFHRAMGIGPEPLPAPDPTGAPSRERPTELDVDAAWVPILTSRAAAGPETARFPGPVPYVMRALSLVPDAVVWLKELSAAHYLPMGPGMMDFTKGRGPLDRAQTELIAGRVSAVNECFY